MTKKVLFLCLIIASLVVIGLSSCNLGATGPSEEIIAKAIQDTQTAQAAVDAQVQATVNAMTGNEGDDGSGSADSGEDTQDNTPSEPTVTLENTATITLTPTITNTPTPEKPMVTVSENTNCRSGDGQAFDLLGTLLKGETAEIVGKSSFGGYWIIKLPNNPSRTCWLWDRYATTSGDVSSVPVMTPPPTPTPTFTPTPTPSYTGTWNVWISNGAISVSCTMSMNQSGKNLNGTLSCSGTDYDISGTVQNDNETANGTGVISGGGYTFNYTWKIRKNINQFTGNFSDPTDSGEMCGAKNGASKPSPCYGP
ncbi:MAG: hypothetical protein JXA19_04025 [Anaerolineales bacterium]|nr:hypothetical protein [Anaerolineales bacterium]